MLIIASSGGVDQLLSVIKIPAESGRPSVMPLSRKLMTGASEVPILHDSCLAPSSAPGIQVLNRFKEIWPNVVLSDFSSGIRDDTVLTELYSETHEMITVMCI